MIYETGNPRPFLPPSEIGRKLMPAALMAAASGRNPADHARNITSLIMDRRENLTVAEMELSYPQVGDRIQDALEVARKMGCAVSEHKDRTFISHPLLGFRFTIKKHGRYQDVNSGLAHFFVKLARAVVRQERVPAPSATVVQLPATTPEPVSAAPEPEPEELVIPETLAPTAVSHVTLWTVYKTQSTGEPLYILRAFDFSDDGAKPRDGFQHATSREAIRKLVPPYLICRLRRAEDAPTIIETWI